MVLINKKTKLYTIFFIYNTLLAEQIFNGLVAFLISGEMDSGEMRRGGGVHVGQEGVLWRGVVRSGDSKAGGGVQAGVGEDSLEDWG